MGRVITLAGCGEVSQKWYGTLRGKLLCVNCGCPLLYSLFHLYSLSDAQTVSLSIFKSIDKGILAPPQFD